MELGLRELDAAWTRHTEDNERPGGFFDQVRSEAPQLDPQLRQLHRWPLVGLLVPEVLEVRPGPGRRPIP